MRRTDQLHQGDEDSSDLSGCAGTNDGVGEFVKPEKPSVVVGGIGDILLSIPGCLEKRSIDLYSHYPGAQDMLEQVGVKVNKFELYDSVSNFDPPKDFEVVRLEFFPEFQLPVNPIDVAEGHGIDISKPIVGLHPFGSNLSNHFWGSKGYPIKDLGDEATKAVVEQLQGTHQVLIFGSPLQVHMLNDIIDDKKNVFFIRGDLWSSIALVKCCNALIGSDSAMKTASAIFKVPTYVFMGNYEDRHRDQVFIDPYIRAGVMKAWTYTKQSAQMVQPAIDDILSN